MSNPRNIPSVSATYVQNGSSTHANALGMRAMQERACQKRGEQSDESGSCLVRVEPA